PAGLGVIRPAEVFEDPIEPSLGEHLVELVIKDVPRPPGEVLDRHPELLLLRLLPPANRHHHLPENLKPQPAAVYQTCQAAEEKINRLLDPTAFPYRPCARSFREAPMQ